MITLRPVEPADAAAFAALRTASRDQLAPFEPDRGEAAYTVDGQREAIDAAIARTEAGTGRSYVIEDDDRPVGNLLLNTIVDGPFFRSCSIGYWVASAETGRGVATAAVGLAKLIAFDELGLRRAQAETLPENTASQRVLARNGFERIGFAPGYLKIAGEWRDHVIFQCRNPGPEQPWTPR